MDITKLKHQIMTQTFEPMYIFTGVETAIRDIYIQQIAQKSNRSVVHKDSVLDVLKTVQHKNLLIKSTDAVYLVKCDKDFLTDFEKYTDLCKPHPEYILILYYESLDKRSKFYKKYSDIIVAFDKLSHEMIIKYIQKDCKLNDVNADALGIMCEDDYTRLLSEMDKIKLYAEACKCSTDDAFRHLAEDGTIYTEPGDVLFKWIDAVLDRKAHLTFSLLQECKDNDEPSLVMLTTLYNAFKHLLQVKNCTHDVEKLTGLTTWQVRKTTPYVNNYRNGEIVHAMKLISKTVSNIKIGKIDDVTSVEYVLVNIL